MKRSYRFLGDEVRGADGDGVILVPVPIEYSTSYMKGAGKAPAAILEASMQIELFNSYHGIDLEGAGIVTLDPEISSRPGLIDFLRENRDELSGAFTCFVGGEHSITPWILEGMDYGDIGIVWLDAHADLREEYLGDRESHACAARNSMRFGRIVEIGVRSLSAPERDLIDSGDGVRVFRRWGDEAATEVDALPENVYLSVDFDAVDPSLLRSVGTPEPDGLLWKDLMDILSHLFSNKNVVGMDAVELCPSEHDETSNFVAARIVYEAISFFISGRMEK